MHGSADMAGMLVVGSRRAFFRCEIVYSNQRFKMRLQLEPGL